MIKPTVNNNPSFDFTQCQDWVSQKFGISKFLEGVFWHWLLDKGLEIRNDSHFYLGEGCLTGHEDQEDAETIAKHLLDEFGTELWGEKQIHFHVSW